MTKVKRQYYLDLGQTKWIKTLAKKWKCSESMIVRMMWVAADENDLKRALDASR